MRIEEVRALDSANLAAELENSEKEMFNLRFQKATQQLANSNALRNARKNIARIKTVLRERELTQAAK